jgi:hypothetical protein
MLACRMGLFYERRGAGGLGGSAPGTVLLRPAQDDLPDGFALPLARALVY